MQTRVSKPAPAGATHTPVAPVSQEPTWQPQVFQSLLHSGVIQAKLTVSQPDDPLEREADQVADEVMRMPIGSPSLSAADAGVQRKCACGCKEDETKIKAKEAPGRTPSITPQAERHIESLHGSGQPLPDAVRSFFEPRFGRDLSDVQVHSDSRANEAASAVQARAFTLGRDIIFAAGEYAPQSVEGQRLLAHELAHVGQQGPAGLQRKRADTREQIGARVTHPPGGKSAFKKIEITFNGSEFVVYGDGKEILSAKAQSGRPYSVRAADAEQCGGSTADSYMNNPRYVGIKDNGPIPEGRFHFKTEEMATFSFTERLQMLRGNEYKDPFGGGLHGGDWGAGRVELKPEGKVMPGPKGCGSTSLRDGFYLHGGIMPGSSGCIDIGNSAFAKLAELLVGYRASITVVVKYTQAAPEVGAVKRALGRYTYPRQKEPSFWDRAKALFGATSD